jgi:hypothetical protein
MNFTIAPALLTPKQPQSPDFSGALWVKNGINIFRGVIDYRCGNGTPEEIADSVRDIVKREFSPGPIVPFAFGVVLQFTCDPPEPGKMSYFIDTKARLRDTWQWVIVCDHALKTAYGIHTWMHGYLTPVYENLLHQLEQAGYKCTSQDLPTDKVFIRIGQMNLRLAQIASVLAVIAGILSLAMVAGKLFRVF